MLQSNKTPLVVAGGGVIGLSTAYLFAQSGRYDVEIIAAQFPPHTTSNKAAAIWSPYHIEPKEKAQTWSSASYAWLEKLAATSPQSGVRMVQLLKLEKDKTPWWQKAVPVGQVRQAAQHELPQGFSLGFFVNVPMVETPIFLDWLMEALRQMGVQFRQQTLQDLSEIYPKEGWLINCTGLGAATLCHDPAMFAIQGHIAKVKAQHLPEKYIDDCVNEALTYIFPRQDGWILGGTAYTHLDSTEVVTTEIEGILARCAVLDPRLNDLELLETYVGLRPGRTAVRLERDPNQRIIHNYGHGGAGFTVAWGCAQEVWQLAQTDTP